MSNCSESICLHKTFAYNFITDIIETKVPLLINVNTKYFPQIGERSSRVEPSRSRKSKIVKNRKKRIAIRKQQYQRKNLNRNCFIHILFYTFNAQNMYNKIVIITYMHLPLRITRYNKPQHK